MYNDPNAGRPARINQWNVALQRQLTKDMSIEAAYVGNRGVWEPSNGLVNLNAITPARLKALGIDLTNAATRTLMTSQIGSATAKAAGYSIPYAGFPTTATVAQALRPFPEYNSGLPAEFVNQGDSYYDSLQVKFIRRLSHGLDVSAAYTFSKTENIGGYINADPYNRAIQKGLDANDYPHIFVTAITYITPQATENKLDPYLNGRLDVGRGAALFERKPDRGAAIAAQQMEHLYVRIGHATDPRSRSAPVPDKPRLPLHRSQQHQPAGPQPRGMAGCARGNNQPRLRVLQRLPGTAPSQ